MGIWTRIRDAATNFGLKVNSDGSTIVEISAKPPLSEDQVELPFQAFLTNQLDSENMVINPVADQNDLFCITSLSDRDIFITHMTIIIADQGSKLDLFGGLPELANGLDFFYESVLGTSIVAKPLTKNIDFFRASTGGDGFGSGEDAFRADVQGGQAILTYLPKFDFLSLFGLTHGLRLRAGSMDRMCLRINDDLTGLEQFDAQAYGKLR